MKHPLHFNRNPMRNKSRNRFANLEKPHIKNSRAVILRIIWYFSFVKFKFLLAIVLLFSLTGLQLLGPFIQGMAIDQGILEGDGKKLLNYLIILMFLYLLISLVMYIQNYIMIGISQFIVKKMRNDIFKKLHTLPLAYFDQNAHGDIMSRVSNDIDLVSQSLTSSFTQIFSSILSLISVSILMVYLNLPLGLITICSLPFIFFMTKQITKLTRKYYKKLQKHLGSLNGLIEESLSSLKAVKLFGTENLNRDKFQSINKEFRIASFKANFLGGIMAPFMNLIRNLNLVIVVFLGAFLAYRGHITIGLIAVFLQYTRFFSKPLNQIAQLYNSLQAALAGAERVFDVMDLEPELTFEKTGIVKSNYEGQVTFKDVNFSYIKGQKVLKEISFKANVGETVAIVGETGAGKTTIVNLLTKFYNIDSGLIEIDGIDINLLNLESLRKNMGFVLQDPFLFSQTVMENIRYGNINASDDEVIQTAKLAMADQFIQYLPQAYMTKLSEEGNNLSEGQKQLIAIARVMLSQPSILVLDEATSNVDTRTEKHIQEAFLNLMKGRTTFIIAHRLNTIRSADKILVLQKGRIVEEGSLDELLQKKGLFCEMYSLQFNKF